MELSDGEYKLLEELILKRLDNEHHHPNDYGEEEKITSSILYRKVKDAQIQSKRR